MQRLSNFSKGVMSGLTALLCYSFIASFGIKVYQNGISSIGVINFRAISAGVLLFFTILLSRKLSFKIEKKDWLRVFANSLALTLFLVPFWQGLKILVHIPTVYALYFTYPFWLALMAIMFLGEKFTKLKVVSLILGTVGTFFAIGFLPSFSMANINALGVGLVALSAIGWAIYLLSGQQLFKKYSFFTTAFYNFLLVFLVFMFIESPVVLFNSINAVNGWYLLGIGVISTYLAYLFNFYAVKKMKASSWSILNLISPFFTATAAYFILSQVVNLYQAFGIALSVFGVYLLYKANETYDAD